MKQFLITPAAGKRLIAKAMVKYPAITQTLESGTVAIIAGTTNGYVAEEILSSINELEGFSRKRFFRGIVVPPGRPVTSTGHVKDENEFPGDVIIKDGTWQKGLTIFDVVNELTKGDIVLKGANAVNLPLGQAAIYIGDPFGGTIGAALQAVVGRRVKLILPVGMEKRVFSDLNGLASRLNAPGSQGPRLLPVPGEIFTEIEAISFLTGAKAELVAGGGINGAEGSVWIAISGSEEKMENAQNLLNSVIFENAFEL